VWADDNGVHWAAFRTARDESLDPDIKIGDLAETDRSASVVVLDDEKLEEKLREEAWDGEMTIEEEQKDWLEEPEADEHQDPENESRWETETLLSAETPEVTTVLEEESVNLISVETHEETMESEEESVKLVSTETPEATMMSEEEREKRINKQMNKHLRGLFPKGSFCEIAPRRGAVAREGGPYSPDYVPAPTIGCMSRGVVKGGRVTLPKEKGEGRVPPAPSDSAREGLRLLVATLQSRLFPCNHTLGCRRNP
jgi:hypothetical protein